jgi:CheY-like chemotaxis protein
MEATRKLRQRGFSSEVLPIIAVTAHAFQEDIKACHAAGMQDHLGKPIIKDDLREILEKWLPGAREAERIRA